MPDLPALPAMTPPSPTASAAATARAAGTVSGTATADFAGLLVARDAPSPTVERPIPALPHIATAEPEPAAAASGKILPPRLAGPGLAARRVATLPDLSSPGPDTTADGTDPTQAPPTDPVDAPIQTGDGGAVIPAALAAMVPVPPPPLPVTPAAAAIASATPARKTASPITRAQPGSAAARATATAPALPAQPPQPVPVAVSPAGSPPSPAPTGAATTVIVIARQDRRGTRPVTEANVAAPVPGASPGQATAQTDPDAIGRAPAHPETPTPKSVDPDGPGEAGDQSSLATVPLPASSAGAGPATASVAPAGPATLVPTAPDLPQARAPLMATAANAVAAPGDMTALVDRLVEARAAARAGVGTDGVKATVMHGDFGAVSLRFRPERDGLAVAIQSADPGFARSAHAALAAADAGELPAASLALSMPATIGGDKPGPGVSSHARTHADAAANGKDGTTGADATAAQDFGGNAGGGQPRAGTRWQEAADARGFVPARAGSAPTSTPASAPTRAGRTVTDGGRGVLA